MILCGVYVCVCPHVCMHAVAVYELFEKKGEKLMHSVLGFWQVLWDIQV